MGLHPGAKAVPRIRYVQGLRLCTQPPEGAAPPRRTRERPKWAGQFFQVALLRDETPPSPSRSGARKVSLRRVSWRGFRGRREWTPACLRGAGSETIDAQWRREEPVKGVGPVDGRVPRAEPHKEAPELLFPGPQLFGKKTSRFYMLGGAVGRLKRFAPSDALCRF